MSGGGPSADENGNIYLAVAMVLLEKMAIQLILATVLKVL